MRDGCGWVVAESVGSERGVVVVVRYEGMLGGVRQRGEDLWMERVVGCMEIQ